MKNIVAAILTLLPTLPAVSQVTAFPADAFVGSIGVNAHFGSPSYIGSSATLVSALEASGIRHVRDSLIYNSAAYQTVHDQLGASGIRTLYSESGTNMPAQLGYASYVSDVEAFEPPNEQNLQGSQPFIASASASAAYASFLKTASSLVPAEYPFLGPTFASAVGNAAMTNGGVTYTAVPPIYVSGGGGMGMACTATIESSGIDKGNYVSGCSCTGGSGYTSAPALEIGRASGDSYGLGATAVATVRNGSASSCSIQNLIEPGSAFSINNIHWYQGGFMPEIVGWGSPDLEGAGYGSLAWQKDNQVVSATSLPIWATESGYFTAYPQLVGGLPEANLAAYVPRLLLNNFANGIARTYLYEFFDEGTDPSNPEFHFGMVRNDGSFKPSYTAVKSLIALLADPGPTFSPGTLNYTLSGATSNVHSVLLQKRDSTYWLALWIAQSGFDVNTETETPVSPQGVTLNVTGPSNITDLYVMDATGNLTHAATSGQSVNLTVLDTVTLLEVRQLRSAITLGNLNVTYDGEPQGATATTQPSGLQVAFSYNGSATIPSAAGTYTVAATVVNPGYSAFATGTLHIEKSMAAVTLGDLTANYNGKTHKASATTEPTGLNVTLTYNGSKTAPSAVGSYAVVGTVNDPNHQGSATGTLVISAKH